MVTKPKNLWRCIRERFLSLECFYHGGAYENPAYWNDRFDRARIEYALRNPWVLEYDFGVRELIEKRKRNVVV